MREDSPPKQLPVLLKALWCDGKDDWESAHNLAQNVEGKEGSWVHAYLHRKEGDDDNAHYWYRLANRSFPSKSLDAEWVELVTHFLK